MNSALCTNDHLSVDHQLSERQAAASEAGEIHIQHLKLLQHFLGFMLRVVVKDLSVFGYIHHSLYSDQSVHSLALRNIPIA